MTVDLDDMADAMLPGLRVAAYERYSFGFNDMRGVWGTTLAADFAHTPEIIGTNIIVIDDPLYQPPVPAKIALALGAAAAVAKNPVVPRRRLLSWLWR